MLAPESNRLNPREGLEGCISGEVSGVDSPWESSLSGCSEYSWYERCSGTVSVASMERLAVGGMIG
jgi:hypothetical protein